LSKISTTTPSRQSSVNLRAEREGMTATRTFCSCCSCQPSTTKRLGE
jgi:hypothetical protein